jgi:hypothetical protein
MHLLPDWRAVARRAWSLRLMAIAAVLSAAEIALPYLVDGMPVGLFASLSGMVSVAAMAARVMAQRGMSE